MIGTILAGALLTTDPGSLPAYQTQSQQTPPVAAQGAGDPITLEGIDVVGRPLDELIRGFVNEVAEPNNGRNLARWDSRICVGVMNLQRETAEFIADRVSTVAEDIGLDVGQDGCAPNVMIVATGDGAEMARTLAREQRQGLRLGGAGMDRGGAAFQDFQTSDRAVRWWQVSMPIDTASNSRAIRLPGDCVGICGGPGSVSGFAPQIDVFAASRLNTQIVDNIFRTVVIVDVDDIGGLSALQLADYIAMVTFAQVDPDADVTSYASILNVFSDPGSASSLTNWDLAYLQGLYASERNSTNVRANRAEVVSSIADARARLRAGEDEDVTQE